MLLNQFPVSQAFEKVSRSRIIVNLNKSIYTPVQSRTKITLDPSVKSEEIGTFLSDGLYMAIAYMYARDELDNSFIFIDHATSTAHISQLHLPSGWIYHGSPDTRNTLARYKPGDSKIQDQDRLLKPTIGDTINEIIDAKLKSVYQIPSDDSIRWQVIRRWFRGKDDTIKKTDNLILVDAQKVEKTKDDQKTDQKTEREVRQKVERETKKDMNNIVATPISALQLLVDAYWFVCKHHLKLGSAVAKPAPIIYVGKREGSKGVYYPDRHVIIMDVNPIAVAQSVKKLGESKSIELVRNDPVLRDLVSSTLPTTTLIHELYHAIRSDDHTKSSHPSHSLKIGQREIPEGSYNQIALEVFKMAVEFGSGVSWF